VSSWKSSNVFTAIVVVCLFLVAFIVVIGGIVCVRDNDYTFSQYLADLAGVYKLLIGAVAAAFGNAYVSSQKDKAE
jgi:hypothetical protein